jgi:hypothetical protein
MRILALLAAVVMAWGAMACGGGAKPPMQPDNDNPAPLDDAGAAAPAPAPH